MNVKKKTYNFKKSASTTSKKKKSKKSLYFGPKTDQAIFDYQNSSCPNEKKEIYHTIIQPSFAKLSENFTKIFSAKGP